MDTKPAPKFLRSELIFLAVVMAVSGLMTFKSLGNIYLWNDEAQTACLARNVLRHGLPVVDDGSNIASEWADGSDYNDAGVNSIDPWGQFYLAALSFAMLQESTFTARLPFALIGWLALLLCYFFFRQLSGSRMVAVWGLLFLAGSTTFYLHIRQARYFAPAMCLTVLMLFGYMRASRRQEYGHPLFVLGAALLFYIYYPGFVFIFAAVFFHFVLFQYRKGCRWLPWLIDLLVLVIVIAPMALFYLANWESQPTFRSWSDPGSLQYFFRLILSYLTYINEATFPLLLIPLAWWSMLGKKLRMIQVLATLSMVYLIFWAMTMNQVASMVGLWGSAAVVVVFARQVIRLRRQHDATGAHRESLELLLLLAVMTVVIGCAAILPPQAQFRYIFLITPLIIYFLAKIFTDLMHRSRGWACALAAVVILTNWVAVLPYYLTRWPEMLTASDVVAPADTEPRPKIPPAADPTSTDGYDDQERDVAGVVVRDPEVVWMPINRPEYVTYSEQVKTEFTDAGDLRITLTDRSDAFLTFLEFPVDAGRFKFLVIDISLPIAAVPTRLSEGFGDVTFLEVGGYFRSAQGKFSEEVRFDANGIWTSAHSQLYEISISDQPEWKGIIEQLRLDINGGWEGQVLTVHRLGFTTRHTASLGGRTVIPLRLSRAPEMNAGPGTGATRHEKTAVSPVDSRRFFDMRTEQVRWYPLGERDAVATWHEINVLHSTDLGVEIELDSGRDPFLQLRKITMDAEAHGYLIIEATVTPTQKWLHTLRDPTLYTMKSLNISGLFNRRGARRRQSNQRFIVANGIRIDSGSGLYCIPLRDSTEWRGDIETLRLDFDGGFKGLAVSVRRIGFAIHPPARLDGRAVTFLPLIEQRSAPIPRSHYSAFEPNMRFAATHISYINEIFHDYDGPVEKIVQYLDKNALPGDTVKTSYASLPLQFYLPHLAITPCRDSGGEVSDWIIPRILDPMVMSRRFQERTEDIPYERIQLHTPDIPWENRPDPFYHKFTTPTGSQYHETVIFRRQTE